MTDYTKKKQNLSVLNYFSLLYLFLRYSNGAICEFQKLSLPKRGLVRNLSCENEFYLHQNKKVIFI